MIINQLYIQKIFYQQLTINLFLMNAFLFFRFGIWMLVKEYKYWKQTANATSIVLLSANQFAEIFWVSEKYIYIYIILNKKTHFQLSQIFRLFYITFYSGFEQMRQDWGSEKVQFSKPVLSIRLSSAERAFVFLEI